MNICHGLVCGCNFCCGFGVRHGPCKRGLVLLAPWQMALLLGRLYQGFYFPTAGSRLSCNSVPRLSPGSCTPPTGLAPLSGSSKWSKWFSWVLTCPDSRGLSPNALLGLLVPGVGPLSLAFPLARKSTLQHSVGRYFLGPLRLVPQNIWPRSHQKSDPP